MKLYFILFFIVVTCFLCIAQTNSHFKYIDTYLVKVNCLDYEEKQKCIAEIAKQSKLNFQFNNTDTVALISKITLNTKNGDYIIIKLKDNKTHKINSLFFRDSIEIKNTPDCFDCIAKLQTKFFIEFYKDDNNSAYPEINKVKLQLSKKNGMIDLCDLSSLLIKFGNELEKYFDN